MYAIAAMGLVAVLLSLLMMWDPAKWCRGMVAFSEKPWFHMFEITSRLALGGVLFYFADSTLHPNAIRVVGGLFLFAGVFLVFIGKERHKALAVRFAEYGRWFRFVGPFSIVFGAFLNYTALAAK